MLNPKIESWSLTLSLPHLYAAPELGETCLQGWVSNHPRLEDGHVTTTQVFAIDLVKNTARTKNTEYDLGEMDLKYAKWLREQNKTVEDIINNS